MTVQAFEVIFSVLKQVVTSIFGMNEEINQTVILVILVVACITYSILCGMFFQIGRNLWAAFMIVISVGSVLCVLTGNIFQSLFLTLFFLELLLLSIFPIILGNMFVWIIYHLGGNIMLMKFGFEIALVLGMAVQIMFVVSKLPKRKSDRRILCLELFLEREQ